MCFQQSAIIYYRVECQSCIVNPACLSGVSAAEPPHAQVEHAGAEDLEAVLVARLPELGPGIHLELQEVEPVVGERQKRMKILTLSHNY